MYTSHYCHISQALGLLYDTFKWKNHHSHCCCTGGHQISCWDKKLEYSDIKTKKILTILGGFHPKSNTLTQ